MLVLSFLGQVLDMWDANNFCKKEVFTIETDIKRKNILYNEEIATHFLVG